MAAAISVPQLTPLTVELPSGTTTTMKRVRWHLLIAGVRFNGAYRTVGDARIALESLAVARVAAGAGADPVAIMSEDGRERFDAGTVADFVTGPVVAALDRSLDDHVAAARDRAVDLAGECAEFVAMLGREPPTDRIADPIARALRSATLRRLALDVVSRAGGIDAARALASAWKLSL